MAAVPSAPAARFETDPPTKEEVAVAIAALAWGTSEGIGGVEAELLQYWVEVNPDRVGSEMRRWWAAKRVVSICKKGKPHELDNGRPLALLTALSKVYAVMLKRRILAAADQHLPVTQYGFRPARSKAQPVFCV